MTYVVFENIFGNIRLFADGGYLSFGDGGYHSVYSIDSSERFEMDLLIGDGLAKINVQNIMHHYLK
jgi:hypothetical protein